MTQVEQIADFALRVTVEGLNPAVRDQLKLRILDSIGCGIGALRANPMQQIHRFVDELDAGGSCTLLAGGKARVDLAAFYNAALVRYLDFSDSYLAKGETCHPSDNLGAILAAGEYMGASGADLLAALAVAYEIQCRLSEKAPVRARGFDHAVQGSYAASAAVGKILGLDRGALANAIAISGTALNALRVTRTGMLSNWKGLAYPHMSADCVRNALLARYGITGPLEAIEGEKGLMDAITGLFEVSWGDKNCEHVLHTVLKKYNAEIHSQTTIEAALQLRHAHLLLPSDIDHVDIKVFDVAYNIIGGGEEGDKRMVRTKEQADHSLPYLVAVALLDGQVMPEQYAPERILRSDVQALMNQVTIQPDETYSRVFPAEMPSCVTITLRDGRTVEREIRTWEGSFSSPMSWEAARNKFERLASTHTMPKQRNRLVETIAHLEHHTIADLTGQLFSVGVPEPDSAVVMMGRR